ncbi:uridine phosphorylase 2-like isoform X1 [Rhopilema esculentum]|uniref:uridine phosphorylase 2-like isoform X1 n=2 Tax=Rhopilema esculentum TaxID=499914 RepID=UPI0031E321E3
MTFGSDEATRNQTKFENTQMEGKNKVRIGNPHLADVDEDNFHHLGFTSSGANIKEEYSDIKFICISGSDNRVLRFAKYLQSTLNINKDVELQNRCLTDRYVMYKVGPVLVLSHGMGIPSASILLHEVFKLLHYAGATDVVLFRMGTSGGLGVKEGTVVVTKQAVDGLLRPFHEQMILGGIVRHPTDIGSVVSDELASYSSENDFHFDVVQGDTMCCNDFYEGQGRLDGAFCEFSKDAKMDFLKKAYASGVRNIEMESLVVASMCRRAAIKAAIVCVTFLNRLERDQISLDKEIIDEFQTRPWRLVGHYIKKRLSSQ